MWKLDLDQYMIQKKLYTYFPPDDLSNAFTENANRKLSYIKEKVSDTKHSGAIENYLESKIISRSYLIRCMSPDTVQSLQAIVKMVDKGDSWVALS